MWDKGRKCPLCWPSTTSSCRPSLPADCLKKDIWEYYDTGQLYANRHKHNRIEDWLILSPTHSPPVYQYHNYTENNCCNNPDKETLPCKPVCHVLNSVAYGDKMHYYIFSPVNFLTPFGVRMPWQCNKTTKQNTQAVMQENAGMIITHQVVFDSRG